MHLFVDEYSRKYYKNYGKDIEIKRPLVVTEVTKGIILPLEEFWCEFDTAYKGGVLDSSCNFVPQSATLRDCKQKAVLEGYSIQLPVSYKDETVIYGGVLYEFYGHVILESMARLWYYINDNPNKYRVVFDIVPGARGKWKEFFELLDIPYNDDTFITEPTQYSKVIIPEVSTIYATSWHKNFFVPFEYMAKNIKPCAYDKIYFTRTKIKDRAPVYGEKEIEKLFKKNGYKVFSPEKLSLRQQIALMKGVKSFASINGSQNHNLIFAKGGIDVIQLCRCFEPDISHITIDESKKHNSYYVDVSLNPLPVTHVYGPWIVGLTKELKEFCKFYNLKFPRKKCNVVSYFNIQKFKKNWEKIAVTIKQEITFDDLFIYQKRVQLKKTFYQKIFKIISKICFGKLRAYLKQEINL